ncbi:hypothetical protein DKX38_014911 [Salix brachista]|uniref:Uncharacterized protein n=1 Tax=Salix brachista TaxID=2182728 RepID=A0A5N5L4F6_9ROSI|nr:hypothetical protein DKX38_014911 [Salix brachista]
MFQERYRHQRHDPPHEILLAVAVYVVVLAPFIFGDLGEAITEAFSELFSPVGLFFLPVILLLVIQFLSSDRGSFVSDVLYAGGRDSIHRVSGSPVGAALVLGLLLFLLYNSIFGGGGDDSDD